VRIVLDTNVLVAAFTFGGICRAALDLCADPHKLILSEHILSEVRRNLRGKFGHAATTAAHRIVWLRDVAEIVTPAEVPPGACRDPDDLPVLGTVLAGMADCLVTGDQDLLILGEFGGHPILSPRQFWHRLK
jgi:putative PIN family toxin of toxin-antitoxin system